MNAAAQQLGPVSLPHLARRSAVRHLGGGRRAGGSAGRGGEESRESGNLRPVVRYLEVVPKGSWPRHWQSRELLPRAAVVRRLQNGTRTPRFGSLPPATC